MKTIRTLAITGALALGGLLFLGAEPARAQGFGLSIGNYPGYGSGLSLSIGQGGYYPHLYPAPGGVHGHGYRHGGYYPRPYLNRAYPGPGYRYPAYGYGGGSYYRSYERYSSYGGYRSGYGWPYPY